MTTVVFFLLFHSRSSLGIHGCLRMEREDGLNDEVESIQTLSKQKISFVFVKETVKCNILCLFLWNGSNRPISFFLCLFGSLVSFFSLFCFTNVYISKKDQKVGWVLRPTGRLFGFCTIQMWFIFQPFDLGRQLPFGPFMLSHFQAFLFYFYCLISIFNSIRFLLSHLVVNY